MACLLIGLFAYWLICLIAYWLIGLLDYLASVAHDVAHICFAVLLKCLTSLGRAFVDPSLQPTLAMPPKGSKRPAASIVEQPQEAIKKSQRQAKHTPQKATSKSKAKPKKARADSKAMQINAKAMQDLLSANALVCQRILADKAQRDNASSKSSLDEVATLLVRLLA